jgi:GrpB-like predicted nucleotidyltransferase (UPF0157 family)
MRPKVELIAHDPAWATIAQVEAERLAAVLGANHLDVQHIGSTAIPGLKAKPIIDLLPRVRSLNVLDGQADKIEALDIGGGVNSGSRAGASSPVTTRLRKRGCSTCTRSNSEPRRSTGISRFATIYGRTRMKRGCMSRKSNVA